MTHPSIPRLLALALLLVLGSLSSAFAVTLLPQEQAIAAALTSAPGQGRPYMIMDPVIQQVAQARARDMATRNYFSEVTPEGTAADYLLEVAGYQLPAWWGTDPSNDYVESIAAGSPSATVTWAAWMNSPPHKAHLLAQNSFYATETHYGVGYAYNPDSTYQYYWVVITAPPEPVEIMSPEPASQLTSASVPLSGLADTTTGVASVQYRIENTSGTGAYQAATGVANWSGTVTLTPGSNVIRAESLDGSGKVISQTVVTVQYLVQGTLSVSVSGSGSVTKGFEGVTSQQVGAPIALAAAPAPGFVFTGWTGSVTSGSTLIRFPMTSSVALQANFEPNPYISLAGSYYGLLTAGSGPATGLLTITVSAGGTFTASILLAGKTWALSGALALDGSAILTIPNPGHTPWTLTLQAAGGQISGTLSDGTASYAFNLNPSTFATGAHPAPQAGIYTMALEPDPTLSASGAPQGCGFATILVGPAGGVALTGHMATGTPFSAMGRLADDGTVALYFVPSGAPAGSSVSGVLTFQSTSLSDLAGTLAWTMPPIAASPYYPAGFTAHLAAVGCRYKAPAPGLDAMETAPGAATLTFAGGGLAPADIPMVTDPAGSVTMAAPGPLDACLSISAASGLLTGSFVLPDGGGARAVAGVVLQKQNAAFGFFRDTTQFGNLSRCPAPNPPRG